MFFNPNLTQLPSSLNMGGGVNQGGKLGVVKQVELTLSAPSRSTNSPLPPPPLFNQIFQPTSSHQHSAVNEGTGDKLEGVVKRWSLR